MSDRTTAEGTIDSLAASRARSLPEVMALVVAWSREEPDRIGEVVLVESEHIFGRGDTRQEGEPSRAILGRHRPNATTPAPPIASARISRAQLRLVPRRDAIEVESIGRCPMLVSGEPRDRAIARAGDTIHLKNEMLFLVVKRPVALVATRSWPAATKFAFGAADPFGFVGEGPAAWTLRDSLAFAALSAEHVLVLGESGTGKELAAATIHGLSTRRARPFIARNAATFPEGLIDAELFGNVKGYPNPGMAARAGLFGEVDGGTLFLDEIGELSTTLQAHLLRVLDRGGEYQRLGDATPARSDFRLVAATNRDASALKHDLAARLTLQIRVPPLRERMEDVPLLVRHLLERARASHETLRESELAVDPKLIDALCRHAYTLNTRELDRLLWISLGESPAGKVLLTNGVRDKLMPVAKAPVDEPPKPPPSREEIEGCLERCEGNVSRAARELGLPSRFALYRLLKKGR